MLPELPTMGETLAGFEMLSWFGLLAPAGTPPAIISRLNAETAKVLANPEVKALLAAGADVTAANNEGITPLIAACSEGHVSVVELLLEHEGVDANARDKDGTSAVMAAAVRGHKVDSFFIPPPLFIRHIFILVALILVCSRMLWRRW